MLWQGPNKTMPQTWLVRMPLIGLSVLSPLVLTTNLLLLLGGEVVRDVESLTDLLRRLALDHVGDGLAANVEERLDVEVVGGLHGFLSA